MNPHFYALEVCGLLPSSITGQGAANAIRDWQDAHGLVADGVVGPATADAMHLDSLARGVELPFAEREFASGDGAALPADMAAALRRTIRMACVVRRDVFGCVPTEVVSGYRSPTWNAKCGGEKASYHMRAMACDLRPVHAMGSVQTSEWMQRVEAMMTDGRLAPGGAHAYTGKARPFLHVDWRGYIARW